jgi:hypothetical protein
VLARINALPVVTEQAVARVTLREAYGWLCQACLAVLCDGPERLPAEPFDAWQTRVTEWRRQRGVDLVFRRQQYGWTPPQAAAMGSAPSPQAPEPTAANRPRGRRAPDANELAEREALYRSHIRNFNDDMQRPPDEEELADASGYSKRTLQRLLKRRKQTYRQFRDETLRDPSSGHLFGGN